MESAELLEQGLAMLVLGMGTVFVFLSLLVLVTSAMSSLVLRYLPAPPPPGDAAAPVSAKGASPDSTMLAAIAAALREHRRKHGP